MNFPDIWLARKKDPKEREEFKGYLLNSRAIFEELIHILAKEEQYIGKREFDYQDGAWAYKQAHLNGMREMLSRVKKLIPRPDGGPDE